MRQATAAPDSNAAKSKRSAWFKTTGETDVQVFDRGLMPSGATAEGPCIIESLESTILVPPDWQANVDDDGFVHLTRRDR